MLEQYLIVFLVAVCGFCVGSFLNVIIYRLPKNEQVVRGRSRCPHCGSLLSWYDLLPVFSYFLLKGKCRHCQVKISWRYPIVEFLTAGFYLLTFSTMQKHVLKGDLEVLLLFKQLFLVSLLIACSFIDLDCYLVPNRLIAAGLTGGLLFAVIIPSPGFFSSLLGSFFVGGFLFLIAVVSKGGMGGGDIKLGAVVGLFLGWPPAFYGLVLTCLIGGIAGLFLLICGIKKSHDPIPFVPFLALGTFTAMICGNLFPGWFLWCF